MLLFALFVLSLIINPVVALSFDEVYLAPKLWWTYGVVVPSAGLLLHQHRQALNWAWPTWLLVALGVWWVGQGLLLWPNALAWWGPPDRADGLLMHLVYVLVALAGLAWAQATEREQVWARLTQASAVGGALLALPAILQFLNLMGVPGEGAIAGVAATPFGGTLGNRGYLGGALAMLFPLAIWHAQRQPTWWSWAAILLVTWGLAASSTRGAWLAGLLALGILAVRTRLGKRVWLAVLAGLTCFLISGVATGNVRLFSVNLAPADASSQNAVSVQSQALTNTSGRGVLWKSALVGIRERPFFGWGPPALYRVMAERSTLELLKEGGAGPVQAARRLSHDPTQPPRFALTHPDGRREIYTLSINKVHNEYLDYALTYGVPVALIVVALLTLGIICSWYSAPLLSAALVAYSAYLFTWPEVIRFAPLAWFILGVALASKPRAPLSP